VRVLLPAYPAVVERLGDVEHVADVPDLFGGAGRLVHGRTDGGLAVLALEAAHLYARPGNPYLGPDGRDWPDNHLRFAALSWAASRIALGALGAWRPDLVHAHDWQAGLAPAYLALGGGARPATVMTIHNIAYQGLFPADRLSQLRLPAQSFHVAGVEYHGQIGFLKAGLYYADRITTVSPTYAREIQRAEHGYGLEGLLSGRADDLIGILNGIDEKAWNPATDPHLAARYSARSPRGKAINKEALQKRLGLELRAEAPLLCVISRLTYQKGLDLLLHAMPELLERGAQIAVLGTGDHNLEQEFRRVAAIAPSRAGVVLAYDEALAHLMQGGADAIVVPSRSEPCGLTQLCGLRYGTLPVVARVGGLADSVIDANEMALADGVATGFVFAPETTDALADALHRALDLYYHRPEFWAAMRKRAMTRKVGWSAAAARYAQLYRDLLPVARRYALVEVD
jgi:starch synthase